MTPQLGPAIAAAGPSSERPELYGPAMRPNAAQATALGWRCHSGWAVVVAVGGSPTDPMVLARDRVELVGGSLPRQPYHAAVESGLGSEDAALLISQVEEAAALTASTVTRSIAATLGEAGRVVVGAGLAAGPRRLPADLATILVSHPLLHAAEGRLYEHAIAQASAGAGLPLCTLDPKTIVADAARALSVDGAELVAGITLAGKRAGPPWQKDHREATAAALVALRNRP